MSRTLNHKKRAAFFDLDLTLTKKDCFRLFLKFIYVTRWTGAMHLPYLTGLLILRKTRVISLKTFKERSLALLKGMTKGEITTLGNQFFSTGSNPCFVKKQLKKFNGISAVGIVFL